MNICIFGDSIAWGASDRERGGWADMLKLYFQEHDDMTQVYNLGICGDNTNDLLARFPGECAARKPDVIVFAIGINDAQYLLSQDVVRVPLRDFSKNIENLVAQSLAMSAKIIFVGLTRVIEAKTTPIPWGPDKYYINECIDANDAALRRYCDVENIPYIAMDDMDQKLISGDGVHPNAAGHDEMFMRIRNRLCEEIE